MFVQLTCIVVDTDPANRQEMSTFLLNTGCTVRAQLSNTDALPALLARPDAPQLVVVNLDPVPQEMLKRVAPLIRQFPQISFFTMSQVVDANLLMDAMHVGVREFVPLPIATDKFAAGLERVANMHGLGKRAQILHLLPSQGGCGSTTVACNIATALARTARTVLIDLDLVRGGVASSFDLRPTYTIADVMESGERIDNRVIEAALAVHGPTNLSILARPDLPEHSQRVTHAGMTRLLSVLARMFDYVVVDSKMSLDPLYAATLQAADLNIMVMQLNVPSARNTERFLGAMRRLGIAEDKARVVVNRFVKKGWDIAPEEVERTLGLKISWMIPNDFKNAITAINFGEPVVCRVPKAEMSISLNALAQDISRKAA
jgi:pilus assembly protein CpaE